MRGDVGHSSLRRVPELEQISEVHSTIGRKVNGTARRSVFGDFHSWAVASTTWRTMTRNARDPSRLLEFRMGCSSRKASLLRPRNYLTTKGESATLSQFLEPEWRNPLPNVASQDNGQILVRPRGSCACTCQGSPEQSSTAANFNIKRAGSYKEFTCSIHLFTSQAPDWSSNRCHAALPSPTNRTSPVWDDANVDSTRRKALRDKMVTGQNWGYRDSDQHFARKSAVKRLRF